MLLSRRLSTLNLSRRSSMTTGSMGSHWHPLSLSVSSGCHLETEYEHLEDMDEEIRLCVHVCHQLGKYPRSPSSQSKSGGRVMTRTSSVHSAFSVYTTLSGYQRTHPIGPPSWVGQAVVYSIPRDHQKLRSFSPRKTQSTTRRRPSESCDLYYVSCLFFFGNCY